ncbi:GNAT family N-acetyltransferase [Exilibacterium tricleocarpae]|uniref:GNAT family N-acetyltransferase n=1 Tax=Exilibacterium tricleocarpae TaxID=2591008 RepID=A0A545SY74_9GAMM|nr:GNAT family N-acetyltransferase [Exilibacterium tricleocarpae]
MELYGLRKAQPDELETLIAIDDEASTLYTNAGLHISFANNHPFIVAESIRWARAIEQELAHVAVNEHNQPVGFVVFCLVDGEPYLDQIAVHPDRMRQGAGTALLKLAITWSGDQPLWLTTYSHLSWNKPYYERHDFVQMPENACGPQLREILRDQRSVLPDPDQRIAMVNRSTSNNA